MEITIGSKTEVVADKKQLFVPEMTISEAVAMNPEASMVFAAFHLGGCSHCAVSEEETIEQVCMGYGIPQDEILAALNSLEPVKLG